MSKHYPEWWLLPQRAKQGRHLAGTVRNDVIRERLMAAALDYEAMMSAVIPLKPEQPMDLAEQLAYRARCS